MPGAGPEVPRCARRMRNPSVPPGASRGRDESGQCYLPVSTAPRYGAVMPMVETVRGPLATEALGTTLMHEHLFILSEEIRQNYPAGWDEDVRVDDAIVKLNALAKRGCQTIVDPTVIGLGRDIRRIIRVADGTSLNIIVATGLYTYDKVPPYFEYRVAHGGGRDPMAQLFIGDITEGIAGT